VIRTSLARGTGQLNEAYQERTPPQRRRSQEAQKQWTCMICNREMQMQSRGSHLAGNRHAMAVGLYQENVYQPQETPRYWTCTICDIEMQIQSRDSHLSGNRHATATQSQQETFRLEPGAYFPERNNNATSSFSTTVKALSANLGVHGITGDTIYAASDLTEVHDTPAVLVWQCTMCSCYVPLSVK
jgi:hypothetical protein